MKSKLVYSLLAAVMALAGTQVSVAGDAAAGEQAYMSKACIGCHGPAGVSANTDIYPSLKGQTAAVITEQLNAFRSGKRNNPLMSPMAAGLSDADVANIAAYIAAQK